MLEVYKGFSLDAVRRGRSGEWLCRYGQGDFTCSLRVWQETKRFSGRGAKAASIAQAKREIDALVRREFVAGHLHRWVSTNVSEEA